jgi:putative membrane protein
MMGYGWGMGPLGWVFMGLFWLVVIGVVVWALATLLPAARNGGRPRPDSPEEILDRRFASGEIDVEQYRRAREELATHRNRR